MHPPLINCHVGVRDSTRLKDAADVSDMETQIVGNAESGGFVLVPV